MVSPAAPPTFLFNLEPWVEQAACRGVKTDLWFPSQGEATNPAKQVCATCPVREECLEYAMIHHEKFGIWGGLSERERRRLRRGQPARYVRPLPPINHGSNGGHKTHLRRGETPCAACDAAHDRYTASRRIKKAS